MGAAALKKSDIISAARLESHPQSATLTVVSQKTVTFVAGKTTAPDFEEFMKQYGIWSDFA